MLGQDKPVVIVGGGIAGAAAALRAVQYNLKVLWFLGDAKAQKRSRCLWVRNVDNMIGLHPGIMVKSITKKFKKQLGEDLIDQIRSQHFEISTKDVVDNVIDRVKKFPGEEVEIKRESVTSLKKADGVFSLTAKDQEYIADYVVLATGVMDQQPEMLAKSKVSDQFEKSIRPFLRFSNHEDLLFCIRCEGHLTHHHPTGVIGHTEDAAQVSCMLYERYQQKMVIITNGEAPEWSEKTGRVLEKYGVKVFLQPIVDILGKPGAMEGFVLEGDQRVLLRFAFPMLGLYEVYNQLAIQAGAELEDRGEIEKLRHVLINSSAETSVENLFAVGDMTRRKDEGVMKQVYTSQEYAVRAVDMVDRRIRRAYRESLFS